MCYQRGSTKLSNLADVLHKQCQQRSSLNEVSGKTCISPVNCSY